MTINISKQDILDYYNILELSANQIANIYDCTHSTILYKMKKFNIPRRSKSEVKKGHVLSEEIKRKISKTLKGHEVSLETKKKISEAQMGEKNNLWKGNGAGYDALHQWIRNHKQKPDLCEICGKEESTTGNKRLVISNKNHKYNRNNFEDWQWVHDLCHRKYDILNNNYGGGHK